MNGIDIEQVFQFLQKIPPFPHLNSSILIFGM